jgi:hypothetical protein|eukprot:SAG25_NODE_2435_length_1610_cov_1.592985_2_plen_60_part_00
MCRSRYTLGEHCADPACVAQIANVARLLSSGECAEHPGFAAMGPQIEMAQAKCRAKQQR